MTQRAVNDARAIAFGALLVVAAGYAFVFRPGEARIETQLAANAALAERTVADRTMLAARPTLERERATLRRQMRDTEIAEPTRAVAMFLRDAAVAAAAHRTRFATIAANPQPAAAGADQTLPIDVTLEGRYVDVLATIGVLSRGRIPAAVEIASLARKSADTADTTLSATLRIALERQTKDDDRVRTESH